MGKKVESELPARVNRHRCGRDCRILVAWGPDPIAPRAVQSQLTSHGLRCRALLGSGILAMPGLDPRINLPGASGQWSPIWKVQANQLKARPDVARLSYLSSLVGVHS